MFRIFQEIAIMECTIHFYKVVSLHGARIIKYYLILKLFLSIDINVKETFLYNCLFWSENS